MELFINILSTIVETLFFFLFVTVICRKSMVYNEGENLLLKFICSFLLTVGMLILVYIFMPGYRVFIAIPIIALILCLSYSRITWANLSNYVLATALTVLGSALIESSYVFLYMILKSITTFSTAEMFILSIPERIIQYTVLGIVAYKCYQKDYPKPVMKAMSIGITALSSRVALWPSMLWLYQPKEPKSIRKFS
ncbi:MAG: cyclic lactone autoinducer peptide [Clostridia bacterium]|nr:cyclic lactone autoinducer peptide [Clostridia bacterium]